MSSSDRSVIAALRVGARLMGAVVFATGCVVLMGWWRGIPALQSIVPGLATMKPNTAAVVLLEGAALFLLASTATGAVVRRAAIGCATVAVVITVLTALEWKSGIDFHIDNLLFTEASATGHALSPGRMSPVTAGALLALGVCLILQAIRRAAAVAQGLAVSAGLTGLLVMTGYIYQAPSLYHLTADTGVAIQTAAVMILLALGALSLIPDRGLMVLVTNNSTAGVLVRRMLPAAVLVPLALGWLRLYGQRHGLYGTEFGLAILVLSNVLLFASLIFLNARLLYRAEIKQSRTELALDESEGRKEAILDTAVDGIITIDVGGLITSLNRAATQIFGYSQPEVLGRNVNLLMPAPFHEEHDGYLKNYLATGVKKIIGIGREVTGKRKDGTEFPMDLAVSETVLGDRRIFTGIVRDITERKRAEEALARQAEALARSNVELERFAYVASHDLQEPMRTVRSFAQLLQRRCAEAITGDAAQYLKFITEGVGRMQTLINDLLTYSRVSSQGAAFAPTDANEVLAKVLENLQASIQSQQAQITAGRLPQVVADKTQLGQVFQNLVGNALKFRGQDPPRIQVSCEDSSSEWIFCVTDNGIGIAPEYFERVFVIFQRLHTIEEYGGTGIGLAICKKIVERHGGKIWVKSAVGQGSTFYFSMPKQHRG